MESENISYQQVAELIGVPVGTVYAWVSNRVVPHLRLGPRLVRFSRQDIMKWLDGRRVTSAPVKKISTSKKSNKAAP